MGNKRLRTGQIIFASDLLDKKKSQRFICEKVKISPNTLQEIKNAKKKLKLTPKKLKTYLHEYYNFHDSKHKNQETYFEKLQEKLLTHSSDFSTYQEKKYSRKNFIHHTLAKETLWDISDYVDKHVTRNLRKNYRNIKQ